MVAKKDTTQNCFLSFNDKNDVYQYDTSRRSLDVYTMAVWWRQVRKQTTQNVFEFCYKFQFLNCNYKCQMI